MFSRSRRFYRLLLTMLLPPVERQRDRDDLEAAFVACLSRERARFGFFGLLYAWLRILTDTAGAGIALRLDRYRRRRSGVRTPPLPPGDSLMATLWQDLRYSVRILSRAPAFSAAIVVTLALAIGASTTVFTVVNTVLLRSLPFAEPDRLVMAYESIGKSGPVGFSAPDFRAIEQRARSFTAMSVFGNRGYELSGVQQPERVTATRVSANLFEVLGVAPAIGQTFSKADDEGRRPVVILSDGLWRRAFAADPAVIGRALQLDRVTYTIVGVMPRSFVFPNRGPLLNNEPADLYVPVSFTARELNGFGSMYNNSVVARLRPGVTLESADAEVRTIADGLMREIYPAQLQGVFTISASAVPLRTETVGRIERVLYLLLAAIGVVLLIACADVANLMLTRAAGRGKEIAVRSALGAERWHLARQVLIEAGVLALAGGILGVLLAYWSTSAVVKMAPATIPRLNELSLDGRVLAFAFAVSATTALICGLVPALELSWLPSGEVLKDGGRGATAGTRQRRILNSLVVTQFALAIVLLAAGGLLVRSFSRLMAVEAGFRPERVLTLSTSLPPSAYTNAGIMRGFYERLLERVDSLPGVAASGLATDLPLSVRERRVFTIEAQPPASAGLPHTIAHDWVIGGYFDALGIALRRGRFLLPSDSAQSERVAVINETMARQFWPNQDPVGQRMAWGMPHEHGPWMRIVGIVGDVKQGPLGTATVAQSYQPWTQQVADNLPGNSVFISLRSLVLAVRTTGDPSSLAAALQKEVRALDPALPVAQVRTMDAVVDESAAPQRFNTVLLSGFAGTALLLAALGIGGVLATTVSRRTREIGVRIALGASRRNVLELVIKQGMTLVVAGLAIGIPAGLLATRLMSSLLFDTSARDPLTFTIASIVLIAVAFVACVIPAWRAARVDPMSALRVD